MGQVTSMEEFHSRKVEIRETGEASRGHDQPVSVDVAKWERSITIQENEIYSTSFEKENFKKLKEAQVKGKNRWTTEPKIQKSLDILDACIPAPSIGHLGFFLRQAWQIDRVMSGFRLKMVLS
ncbi:hypothetical protein CFP56_040828 [Quercus suber]|uniref:Uncharacterized protein n=1 Tax=Quercus suber TaxID=58331 RepID=A0AAW0IX85_QUESU